MKDYIIRGISKDKTFRLFVARTTNLVEKARRIHNTSPTATAALGRALTAAVMMGITMKGEKDSLTFKIEGNGPIGSIVTVANSRGEVKGYVDNPYADIPSRPDGKLDVGGLVGKDGQLVVIKDLGLKEPYIGMANLVSGEIAEDLVHYFYISEQQPSAVSLGVLVDKDISVKAAGGYMLQLLPDIADKDLDRIEKILSKAKPVSTLINEGLTPEEIMVELFGEFDMEILDKRFIDFKCNCQREKIENILLSLGKEEIEDMIKKDGKAEIVCNFCNSKYLFSKEDLYKLINDN
ncbi:molecular chaperone Hsp33 [Keratinibaculum paraultunense]|uniref:33 kDa chaperonin n=1 Tax=Keratinibaculum paraultunense TaxID=1278232 RepID=A0A4R3KYH2_9FIRM|nr:Hsp33 family molecular chaperone HslO [Keratinibaculum paraultunense]QQY80362.1 Hsp33 family molecular chaperone HslO [Keratinibaculum paraultunense]TCS90888.1 molecular chaperone Hsp33 [Keratinibaculum paraultunense]